ncbi:hypothetical protein ET495_15415 [Xylanimonas allomyrinae]|uniref:Uncharacterized protein n=1 Tax=Xylanimonas allomyrinae TaxID=2509459 RepID=A0A4P6EV69_9MICO|nr:hypothetical protein [Xylanimonas allomyrinae]QAY64367.1 hypothetical protein ET495_15415 [Xylanimonas allomyrinae]
MRRACPSRGARGWYVAAAGFAFAGCDAGSEPAPTVSLTPTPASSPSQTPDPAVDETKVAEVLLVG